VHWDDIKDVKALLDAFYNSGHRDIDTAQMYPFSEDRLGKAGVASHFTIHTKVWSGTPGDHKAEEIPQSIERSLQALQTSSVETMFLHVPDRQTPFEETARAMDEAMKQGKFKHVGLSNYSAAEVQKFIDICEEKGYNKPTVYEGHYNALVRGGEKELFPLLRKHNIVFFAYRYAARFHHERSAPY
jgi:aflatoxin B1 aldehyde reductase